MTVMNSLQFLEAVGREPNGVEVLWNPAKRLLKSWEGEAPAEPPNAGPRSDRLPAFLRSSGDRCSARGRDAAQQELRPPGSAFCQKVNAIERPPAVLTRRGGQTEQMLFAPQQQTPVDGHG
jgi:hypothetical protein